MLLGFSNHDHYFQYYYSKLLPFLLLLFVALRAVMCSQLPPRLESESWMEAQFDQFMEELRLAGWSLTSAALGVQQWRAQWGEALHLHTS
jgi:hypothetical protein